MHFIPGLSCVAKIVIPGSHIAALELDAIGLFYSTEELLAPSVQVSITNLIHTINVAPSLARFIQVDAQALALLNKSCPHTLDQAVALNIQPCNCCLGLIKHSLFLAWGKGVSRTLGTLRNLVGHINQAIVCPEQSGCIVVDVCRADCVHCSRAEPDILSLAQVGEGKVRLRGYVNGSGSPSTSLQVADKLCISIAGPGIEVLNLSQRILHTSFRFLGLDKLLRSAPPGFSATEGFLCPCTEHRTEEPI